MQSPFPLGPVPLPLPVPVPENKRSGSDDGF